MKKLMQIMLVAIFSMNMIFISNININASTVGNIELHPMPRSIEYGDTMYYMMFRHGENIIRGNEMGIYISGSHIRFNAIGMNHAKPYNDGENTIKVTNLKLDTIGQNSYNISYTYSEYEKGILTFQKDYSREGTFFRDMNNKDYKFNLPSPHILEFIGICYSDEFDENKFKNGQFNEYVQPITARITSFGDYPDMSVLEMSDKFITQWEANTEVYEKEGRRWKKHNSRVQGRESEVWLYDSSWSMTGANESHIWSDSKISFNVYIPDTYDGANVTVRMYRWSSGVGWLPNAKWYQKNEYNKISYWEYDQSGYELTVPSMQNLEKNKTYSYIIDMSGWYTIMPGDMYTVEIYADGELITGGTDTYSAINVIGKDTDKQHLGVDYQITDGENVDVYNVDSSGKVIGLPDSSVDYDIMQNTIDGGINLPDNIDYKASVDTVSKFFTSVWGLLPLPIWTIILAGLTLIILLRVLGR